MSWCKRDRRADIRQKKYDAQPKKACPAVDCRNLTPERNACCLMHWAQLPKGLQKSITREKDPYQQLRWMHIAQIVWSDNLKSERQSP